jgi:O-acetyl-ADP-ribose deacetylase (regulator of RNase III)
MPTIFTKGDLFNAEGIRAYAHGCNCAGSMEAGIASAFRKKWPAMFEDYRAHCDDRRFHLGDVLVWTDKDETIFSLAIQEHWKQKAQIAALTRAIRRTVELAKHAGIEKIGLPRIAAGLGGLDWPRVKKVLNELGAETTVTLVVFEQFIRAGAPSDDPKPQA